MEHLGLSLVVLGAATFALPFLDRKDDRARAALFGICILLTWRYLVRRRGIQQGGVVNLDRRRRDGVAEADVDLDRDARAVDGRRRA